MTTSPALSVVVPTFDRPDALARLLDALAAQRGAAIEAVVVDDGGSAPLETLVARAAERLDVRLIRQANAGPAAARNRGAAAARAAMLAFTDDDCAPRPTWAAEMLRALGVAQAREGEAVLVGGRTVNAIRGDLFAEASQDIVDFLSLKADPDGAFAASNNIALARWAFEAIGGFDETYPLAAGEDRAFCRSWARRGWRVVRAPEAVIDHHHRLGLRRFWRQHHNYGRGARVFHAGNGPTEGGAGRTSIGFYASLVAHPLQTAPGWRGAARSGLVALAQLAAAAGYHAESRAAGAVGRTG